MSSKAQDYFHSLMKIYDAAPTKAIFMVRAQAAHGQVPAKDLELTFDAFDYMFSANSPDWDGNGN